MKFVALIMAFLVLALSVMPCADAGTALNDSKAKSDITKTTDRQDHNDADDCSPFCHCSCCAGFSINHFFTSIALIAPHINIPTGRFLQTDAIEIVLPIWQPPQIV